MTDGDSRSAPCTEDDFRPLLRGRLGGFRAAAAACRHLDGSGDPRAASVLAEESWDLLRLLDNHAARWNRTYGPLTELVGAVRGFAIVGATLGLLGNRIGQQYPDLDAGGQSLSDGVRNAIRFVMRSLGALLSEVHAELDALVGPSAAVPGSEGDREDAPRLGPLPRTVDADLVREQEHHIAALMSKFLAHKQVLDKESSTAPERDVAAMGRYLLEVSDEAQCRYFETRVQTVLSRYDLYVRATLVESRDAQLLEFRALVDVMARLARTMTELVRFYELHEDSVRSDDVHRRIAGAVSKDELAQLAVSFALRFLRRYADAAAGHATVLLQRYTQHGRITCSLPEGVHFHVRPVSLIARIVQHHGTPVTLILGDQTCYAGSIVQMLMTAGANPGVRDVGFEGDRPVLDDLAALFAAGLGEDRSRPWPPQLDYLGLK